MIGTILCVAGAVAMALVRGPKLLNSEFIPTNGLLLILGKENNENLDSNWILGVILLIASAICWSFWLIMQVFFLFHYSILLLYFLNRFEK